MIKHIVMFKLMDAEGRTEYENAVEAQKRFENVIANVPQLKRARSSSIQRTLRRTTTLSHFCVISRISTTSMHIRFTLHTLSSASLSAR